MARAFIWIFLCIFTSCSIYNSIDLVDRNLSPKTQFLLDDNHSILTIKGLLLDSKPVSTPSLIIFTIQLDLRSANIRFESNKAIVYFKEQNSNILHEILITDSTIIDQHLPQNQIRKFKIIATIHHSMVSDLKSIDKIGLKLPQIMVGDEKLDFGIIDFKLHK